MKSHLKLLIVVITMFSINCSFGQQTNSKSVYAHFVTWFKTKEFSGKWEMWNSDYNESPHNPDTIFISGQRDLAVTSYPLTGPYDTVDPDILEYQFLLMRLSGIDGIIVDWDGRRINQYRHEALMKILPYLEKYNLKLIMCFEEWCGYWPRGTFADRQVEIKAAKDEMQWMAETFLNKPFYGSVGGKKPVLVFRKIPDKWFNSSEWQDIAKDFNCVQLIFDAEWYYQFGRAVGGKYFWVGSFDPKTNNSSLEFCKNVYANFFNQKNQNINNEIIFAGATPGFDDSPVWGWGTTARKAPRYDGERFEMTWQMSIDNKADVVQIITWNDWNEGTQIEPCDKYGYKYLELNKKYSAMYKGVKDDVPNDILRIPLKLYKARKAAKVEKAVLDELSAALYNKEFDKARLLTGKIND
jgi:hypothetical protein